MQAKLYASSECFSCINTSYVLLSNRTTETKHICKCCAALPLKSIQPCGILDHHIRKERRTETNRRRSKEFYGQEITLPSNRDSVHRPCSFCHLPVRYMVRLEKRH